PARLALRRHDQVGDQDAEEREDHTVEHGVLRDQPRRDGDGRRVAHTLERRGAEHGGRAERLSSRGIVDEEPGGDDCRSDEASDDAFAEIPGPGVHGGLLSSRMSRGAADPCSRCTTTASGGQPGRARAGYVVSGARRTTILPRLSPEKRPRKALGAFSIPSTTVSSRLMRPALSKPPTSARNSG